MCFLVGKIRDKFTTDTRCVLTMIFGRCGVGSCHEYDSHNFFCGLTSATHPCWYSNSSNWENVSLGVGPRQKVIFRNINNISEALRQSASIPQRYLLPSIALIVSIIPNNIVLQMTISTKHRGAVNRMAEIHKELGKPQSVIMIFVVPDVVIAHFDFPTDLPHYVTMYVTVAKCMTLADAKKLR